MGGAARGALAGAGVALLGMVIGSVIGLVIVRAIAADPDRIAGLLILVNVAGVAVGGLVGVLVARRDESLEPRTALLAGGGGAFATWLVLALLGVGGSTAGEILASVLYGGAGASAGALSGLLLSRHRAPTQA